MQPTFLFVAVGSLGLLMLVAAVVLDRLGPTTVVQERLGRYAETGGLISTLDGAGEARAERRSQLADFFDRLGEGTDLFDNIARHLARADIKFRPSEYIALIVVSGIGCFFVGSIVGRSIGFGFLSGIFGLFLPPIYVLRAQRRRLKLFNNQLGDMLNLTVNGLRAGYSTLQALEAVSRELPSPISDEFHRVVQEMQIGISMEKALDNLLRRIPSEDLDFVITAINVQREVGGNLSEILDTISFTIRERVRIKGEIRVLTTQVMYSGRFLSILPIIVILILYVLNREYMMTYFQPESGICGYIALGVAAVLIVAGYFSMQKLGDIEV